MMGPTRTGAATARRALCALLLAAAAAGAAEAQRDYRKDLRLVQSHQGRKRYTDAVRLTDEMLAYFKESWQVREVTWLKVDCLVADDRYETALKVLADLAGAYADDRKLQAGAARRKAEVLRAMKKPDEAVAALRKLAEDFAADQPDQAAAALLAAGDVLCADLEKPAEGVALYEKAEEAFGARLPAVGADAQRRIAAAHEARTKDPLRAAEAYRTLADKYAATLDDRARADAWRKAVECFVKAEKPDEALAAARKAEDALTDAPEKARFAARQADVLRTARRPAEARDACLRLLCAYPLEQAPCREALAAIVETYRAEEKWADALGAARVAYDAAGDEKSLRDAAQTVAQAFLAADGNLLRANEFLTYQRHGPDGPDGKADTDDDVKVNHLAKIRYPAFGAAADRQFQAAVDAQDDRFEGRRAKGYLYVYWGRPKDAASQFLRAFKAAKLAEVPAAAQELVLVGIKAHTASLAGLERVFEYVSYGPKGKSGKEKLPDPFAGL